MRSGWIVWAVAVAAIGCATPEQPSPSPLAPPASLGRTSLAGAALPCEVQTLVKSSCQSCHAREPGALAPMALVTQADFAAPAISDPSRTVRELARLRIHDHARPMPPLASRRLTAEELARLDRFLTEGAPAATDECAAAPDAGPKVEPHPIDDLGECYRFQAHDLPVPGDTTPFQLETGESYACFYFAVPWPEGAQAVSLRSLDTPLLHHWQLYHTVEPFTDGQTTRRATNCGLDLREVLGVYSHSEEREQRMPAGVGLELPPPGSDHGILLEVHYNNPGATVADTTGVEVCTAKAPRPNVAGVAVLGLSIFTLPAAQRSSVTGTCTPAYDGQTHIFRAFPHMHARGVSMNTVIVRNDRRRDVLIDVPFDFNNQVMYETKAVLEPGDRLVTSCHYLNDTDQPISAGFAADEEMCIQFVYAYPPDTLSNGNVGDISGLCLF